MKLLGRLTTSGPKRMLALDGGGIRGALSVGFLKRLETILRERSGRADLVLANYFDLIGGTSTGAIIAAALAIGMSAKEVEDIYLEFGGEAFSDRGGPIGLRRLGLFRGRYSAEPLRAKLQQYFGDRTLGDESVRTGLCIVTKRADTNSIWPLLNHPGGRYYSKNKDILLRRAVRASTAAPTYFDPENIDLGGDQSGAFVDGGVSLYNNPSLLLFLVATLKGFPFRWETGQDKLLLVSVGTGNWQSARSFQDIMRANLFDWGTTVPGMLMDDATWLAQLMLQYLSKSPTAVTIDREIGDLKDDLLGGSAALTYLRYNVDLEEESLRRLGLQDLASRAAELREMSKAENRYELNQIGNVAAEILVQADHLPKSFDVIQVSA
jgi:patatin-like phospholipase/acyl hydrolase